MGKEYIVFDSYNGCVKADQTAINTLTTNCGAYGMRGGVKIIIYDRTTKSGKNRRNARTSRESVRSGRTLSYIDNNGGGGNSQPKIMEEKQNSKVKPKCRIRKLTPRECWRLMGFSDEDFDRAKKVNSDSQLYKQAGNSIVVPVLEEIFRRML